MRSCDCPLSPQLAGIHKRAQREKKRRFDNLFSLLTPEMLQWSYYQLRRQASAGVDGVRWEEYGENLSVRIHALHGRLVEQRYRAPDVRRTYIPKANGKQRPLGIPCLEDKIVQRAMAEILNSIFEADFLPISYGYRKGIGAPDAHRDLAAEFHHGTYGYAVEADIKGFFDNLDHDWLVRMVEERIDDPKIIRLLRKWLKAGILEPDGQRIDPESGTPQGGIVSPVLANIYLHYALDLWFVKVWKRRCSGRCFLIRYADDFVAGFQRKSDALAFEAALPTRLHKFHLEVEPSKTGTHRFSRFSVNDGGSFDFLSFTFRWQRGREGQARVGRSTSRKSFKGALTAFSEWLQEARNWPRHMLFASLKRKLAGYWQYFGVNGNSYRLRQYWTQIYLLLYKWLNRCSQRRSYTMAGLTAALQDYGIPGPHITEPLQRTRKPFLWQCT